ncbi:MAG TPA: TetR/AcrR family transcriptional regulator [Xanthomonadales bacterium]|nr:TetR/AcrR family transcriptional regulator [Xanthomonadales bacterium]
MSGERARGRPTDLESGQVQQALLDAAEDLFAEQGFAATPVRQIAERAGVNPALVHYYFGNKKDLLLAVMDRTLQPLAQALARLRKRRSVSTSELAALLFEMAGEHPNLPRLIVREVMLTPGELQDHFISHYAPRLGGALPALVAREQRHGRINSTVEPASAALILLAVCLFPFIARAVMEPVLGLRLDADGRDHLRRQIAVVLEQGMGT